MAQPYGPPAAMYAPGYAPNYSAPPPGQSPMYSAMVLEPLPPVAMRQPPPPPPPVAQPEFGQNGPPIGGSPAGPSIVAPPQAVVVEEVFVPPVTPIVPPKIWDGSVELGVNGAEGNSENFNFRFLVNAKRTTGANIFSVNTRYIINTANSLETANRLFGEARDEWLLTGSPWSIYIHGTGEYDEFRAFDVRLTGDAGIGYQFIKNDIRSLLGRVGPGFSHELGGPDDGVIPEAVFGLAYEQKVTAKSKVTATSDYFPDMSEFGEFRLNNQVNWEVCLDAMLGMSLKFSVLDRYDSTPNGAKANDLDYSATILWCF